MTAFFYSLAVVGFFCALYPFTFYPITILLLNKLRKAPNSVVEKAASGGSYPTISIVFCAHNEALSITAKLSNVADVMAAYPGRCEALVYLDGCTDETAVLARAHPAVASAPGLVTLLEGTARAGKSHGMNVLLARAQGDIIVFTDANVILDERCLLVAAKVFETADIGCICGHLVYVNPNDSATAEVGSLYWRFEEWLKTLESVHGSTVGADGSLFALRRKLFRVVPSDIIDDMYTSMGALIQGYRVVRVAEFKAFETHVTLSSDEFRRKVRIACRAVNCMRLIWPEIRRLDPIDQYKVVGHKVLRWPVIFFLAIGLASLAVGLLLNGSGLALATMAAFLGMGAVASRFGGRPFLGLREVFWAFCASGLGVVDSYRGKRYQTWAVAGSSRTPT